MNMLQNYIDVLHQFPNIFDLYKYAYNTAILELY